MYCLPIETNNLLRKKGVSTTNVLQKYLKEIIELSKEKGIFIKARYGALGKGISYLSPKGWFTNYKVGNNKPLLVYLQLVFYFQFYLCQDILKTEYMF